MNAEGGDYASAKAQLPTVIAAIETPDDRYMAGNLTLLLGNKLKDPVLQRQGLELMLASGKVDPAQVGPVPLLRRQPGLRCARTGPRARTARAGGDRRAATPPKTRRA